MNTLRLLRKYLFIAKRKFFLRKKPFVYVALGDSTVEGIGATTPEKTFPSIIYSAIKQEINNATYYNLGAAGARVEDALKHQLEKAIELKPDLIVISLGANDMMQRRSLKTFEREFEELTLALSKLSCLIVINGIPDLSMAPIVPKYAIPYCKIQGPRYNKIIENQAKKVGAIFVDMYKQSKLYKGYPELVSSDGLHPSDTGYALWANTIITRIYPTLLKII